MASFSFYSDAQGASRKCLANVTKASSMLVKIKRYLMVRSEPQLRLSVTNLLLMILFIKKVNGCVCCREIDSLGSLYNVPYSGPKLQIGKLPKAKFIMLV